MLQQSTLHSVCFWQGERLLLSSQPPKNEVIYVLSTENPVLGPGRGNICCCKCLLRVRMPRPVMAKVVLPKSGPADHLWTPKLVRPDHICPPKMVLPCQKRSPIQIVVKSAKSVLTFFFLQLEDNLSGLLFTILL